MAKKKAKAKPGAFVLDASTTLAWFFEDEVDAYADSVEDALASAVAVVPALWPLEVANALLMGERRKRTIEAKVTQFVALLASLPITMDDETAARAWQESLRLARAHHLTVYDAAYLELALRRGLPLAALDGPLKNAAAAVGVVEYTP
jgi:predicted nucleic acid-binding protein